MALREPRYLGILLSISLALNLFAAGAFFGGWFARQDPDPASGFAGVSFSRLVAALPENVRDEAQSALTLREGDLRIRLEALREARMTAEVAFLADPFFTDTLDAGLAEVRARGGDVQTALHEIVIEMVEDLDTTDRAALAELLFADTLGLRLAARRPAPVGVAALD